MGGRGTDGTGEGGGMGLFQGSRSRIMLWRDKGETIGGLNRQGGQGKGQNMQSNN